jgi:hypothetical protein
MRAQNYIAKYPGDKVHGKSAFLICCVFLACMAIACNGDKSKSGEVAASKGSGVLTINPEDLYGLFISNQDLSIVLNNTDEKLVVLQFFHRIDGELTLDAWPRNNKDYFGYKVFKQFGQPLDNLKGKDVHLGTLNIELGNYTTLLNNVKMPAHANAYYIFEPTIDEYHGVYHIVYNISISLTDPRLSGFTISKLIIATLNPSPPRQAN